ncbi:hypothetical protein [Streptomyces sp. SLBN-118]|uniref:hypothetical protein n=1 Tax=Streptomyces sp. SLBN-118 TaxID=2768454 RepID=UPI0011546961|nr:hypothetical protein [Streptomyces sp. SLBN-118]
MTLTRGARITGAVLCAALALTVGGWIGRDLTTVDDPLDLWRFWTGNVSAGAAAPLTTALEDLLLFAVYAAVAIAALRSSVAATALVAAGVVTLAVRLPGLWVLSSSWMGLRTTDELRTRALYSTFAALGLGVGLIITAAAGRRAPAAQDPYSVRGPLAAHERTPTRPAQGVSVIAFLLLGTAAAVLAAWEAYTATEIGRSRSLDRFTGSDTVLMPLLGTPPGWLTAVTVALALAAAFGALSRAVHSRPLGLVAGVLVLGTGGRGVGIAVRNDLVDRLGDLPTRDQLLVLSWLFEVAAGLTLLVALGRRGEADGVPGAQPVGAAGGFGPPPPSSPPPGW